MRNQEIYNISAVIGGVPVDARRNPRLNLVDSVQILLYLVTAGLSGQNTLDDINEFIKKAMCIEGETHIIYEGDKTTKEPELAGYRTKRPGADAKFCRDSKCSLINTCFMAEFAQTSSVVSRLPDNLLNGIVLDI